MTRSALRNCRLRPLHRLSERRLDSGIRSIFERYASICRAAGISGPIATILPSSTARSAFWRKSAAGVVDLAVLNEKIVVALALWRLSRGLGGRIGASPRVLSKLRRNMMPGSSIRVVARPASGPARQIERHHCITSFRSPATGHAWRIRAPSTLRWMAAGGSKLSRFSCCAGKRAEQKTSHRHAGQRQTQTLSIIRSLGGSIWKNVIVRIGDGCKEMHM